MEYNKLITASFRVNVTFTSFVFIYKCYRYTTTEKVTLADKNESMWLLYYHIKLDLIINLQYSKLLYYRPYSNNSIFRCTDRALLKRLYEKFRIFSSKLA